MAATNVQAFSGDVTISSNLAVDTNTLFVDSVGNRVGIGTTEPGSNLYVTGNAYVSSNLAVTGNVTISSNLAVDTNTLFVDSVGNRVGIGTTGPGLPLETYTGNGANYGLRLRRGAGAAFTDLGHLSTPGTEGLAFNVSDGVSTTQEVMRVTGTGRVGIGTNAPERKLDIWQSAADVPLYQRIQNVQNNAGCGIELMRGDGTTFGATAYSDWRINNSADLDFGVKFTDTDIPSVLHLDTTGNVGIGTTSPTDKLHVNGSLLIQHDTVYDTISTAGWYKIGVWDPTGTVGARLKMRFLGMEGYSAQTPSRGGETILYASCNNNNPSTVANMTGIIHAHGPPAITEVKFVHLDGSRDKFEIRAYVKTFVKMSISVECNQTDSFTKFFTASTDPGVDSATVGSSLFSHVFDNLGNVGIGTNNPNQGKLQIVVPSGGTALYLRSNDYNQNSGTCNLRIGAGGGASSAAHHAMITGGHTTNGSSYLSFSTINNATQDGYNPVERMRIDNNGNVGIGTATPVSPLYVKTTITGDSRNSAVLTIKGDLGGNDISASQHRVQLRIENYQGTYSNRALGLGVLNNGYGTIQASAGSEGYFPLLLNPVSGNVGINRDNPIVVLDVLSGAGRGALVGRFYSTDTTSSRNSGYIGCTNPAENTAYFGADGNGLMSDAPTSTAIFNNGGGRIGYTTNGAIRAELTSGGTFNSQSFGIYSDERIKDNITDVDDAESLEIIRKLQPKNFVMRENRDKKKWGFIAQDVEQVVPEVVSSDGDQKVYIRKKYEIVSYNPPVKVSDVVYSNVSIAEYDTLDANVQVYYSGPDSSNTYYSNIVTEAVYSKSNVSALITDEVFDIDDCIQLSVDETYSLNVCCLNVTSVSNNVYVFQDDCIMTVDDHDLVDMNLSDYIYVKSKNLHDTKSINFEFMNPVIISAIQQLIRIVDDLKERVTVLENT